jgi:VWFA-related protein
MVDWQVMNRSLICFVLLLSVAPNLPAQQLPAPASPAQSTTVPEKPKTPGDQEQDTVRITTNLVQVDVIVTKDGKQVTDLTPEDFELYEDGRLQKITQFSYVSTVPAIAAGSGKTISAPTGKNGPVVAPARVDPAKARRTIALVVDDLGTSFESMDRIRRQLRKFLDEQLQPTDLVAIIHTGGEVGALQQFTTDKRVLQAAIENLKWNHCSRVGATVLPASRPFDFGNENPCVVTSLSNTLKALRFILSGMRDLPGRKSMVLMADNLPAEQKELFDPQSIIKNKSREGQRLPIKNIISNSLIEEDGLHRVAELAIRSAVVIYGVDAGGLQTTGINAADEIFQGAAHLQKPENDPTLVILRNRFTALRRSREGAELLARESGGFVVHNGNDFGLQQIMDDQQGYYLIGYRPSEETFNRSFHQIKARVKRAGLTVRTRSGFFGVTDEQARAAELKPGDRINRALASPFGANDLPVHLTTFFVNDPAAGSLLRSFLYLDARDLTFNEQADGSHEATFELSSIVFGDNGAVIDRKDRTAELRLRGEPYERVLQEGVVYGFDTPVKESGTFQFRIAVRDKTSSRVGSAGQFAEIPNLAGDRLALSGIVVRNEKPSLERSASEPAGIVAYRKTTAPAARRFHQGSTLIFGYAIYNARLDQRTGQPHVSSSTRIWRDGKLVFTGDPIAIDAAGQPDLKRLNGAARFQLGPALPPGEYVLEITVADSLAKGKPGTVTQSIDFEVVK